MNIFGHLNICQILVSTLIGAAVLLALYNLIIVPANLQIKQQFFINKMLKPGLKIEAHNHISGTVILVLDKTVIVEQCNGQKVEILKQTIKWVDEKN